MKKFLVSFISIIFLITNMINISVSAKVVVNPDYDIHGNKCGEIIIKKDIDRDIYITITMHTPDGDYVYYNSVISADTSDLVYSYLLEGKNDSSYTVSIGVSKYEGSDKLQKQEDNIIIYDVDEITEEIVSGYQYLYTVTDGEEIKIETTSKTTKNEKNIYIISKTCYFLVSDIIVGDINTDGVINIRDAATISKALANGEKIELWADYNGDEKVNVRDAAAIATDLASSSKYKS